MKTFLIGLLTFLLNFSALECSSQASKLPKEMPENVEINFHQTPGLIGGFKHITIVNQTITVKEKDGGERQAREWSAKIEKSEQENLYKLFVESRFDTIKNEEPEEYVHDMPSDQISLTPGTGASYGIAYGPNSPLSGDNRKSFQTISNAINALRAKYDGKDQKTSALNFAILNLNEEHFNLLFKNSYPAKLSDKEISSVNAILKKAVDEYNLKQTKFSAIEKLDEYKFQFIALLNPKGDKEVWVNGFCSDFEKDWRTEIIMVKDGGSCFFNFYVNLTKQTFDRFSVNGSA